MTEDITTLARNEADGYEIVLRRRVGNGADVDELIVNGAFAMDSAHIDSEIALAEAIGPAPGQVLVGGLGLGFTADHLLHMGATHLDIVELSLPLIEWAREGLTPVLARLADDPRVTLHHGDIVTLLAQQPALPGLLGPWDNICLDIDNGPSFLIHENNAHLYTIDGIRGALEHLRPSGTLAIWAQGPSKDFWFDLLSLDPDATERLIEVERGTRRMDYAIYSVHGPA
ncbi:MAG: hypothetical protein LBV06_06590 [Propionibacteriaceae bacterium]|jgi:spermidine synthase|nr:hypothetical protein [Propionibacteriaceae bacterium]